MVTYEVRESNQRLFHDIENAANMPVYTGNGMVLVAVINV